MYPEAMFLWYPGSQLENLVTEELKMLIHAAKSCQNALSWDEIGSVGSTPSLLLTTHTWLDSRKTWRESWHTEHSPPLLRYHSLHPKGRVIIPYAQLPMQRATAVLPRSRRRTGRCC